MPHINSGGDDLASTDEVKVYHDEGEDEERSAENLSEDKLGLLTETEEEKDSDLHERNYPGGEKTSSSRSQDGKTPDPAGDRPPSGYPFLTPYPYHNGGHLPGLWHHFQEMQKHMGDTSRLTPPLPLVMYNNEFSPPPAHMGIPPVPMVDPKTGLPRPPMYPIPPGPGQFPLYAGDFGQWNGYPLSPGLRSPYAPYPLSSSPLGRFSPPGLLPPHLGLPPGMPPHLSSPAGIKSEMGMENGRLDLSGAGSPGMHNGLNSPSHREKKARDRPYVKKPLNAFMLFMKQERQKVIEEGTLKESAAINQILGRRWHALDRAEQSKYYDMARKEKELHMQLYPGWSARDNYAAHAKKKKTRKRPDATSGAGAGPGGALGMSPGGGPSRPECTNPKKCRARFGLDQQSQWCKPCRRKKKCIRFMEEGDEEERMSGVSDTDDIVSTTTGGDETPHKSTTSSSEGGAAGSSSPPPPLSSHHSHHHNISSNTSSSGGATSSGDGGHSSNAASHHHRHHHHHSSSSHHSTIQHHQISSQTPSHPLPPPAAAPAATTTTTTKIHDNHHHIEVDDVPRMPLLPHTTLTPPRPRHTNNSVSSTTPAPPLLAT